MIDRRRMIEGGGPGDPALRAALNEARKELTPVHLEALARGLEARLHAGQSAPRRALSHARRAALIACGGVLAGLLTLWLSERPAPQSVTSPARPVSAPVPASHPAARDVAPASATRKLTQESAPAVPLAPIERAPAPSIAARRAPARRVVLPASGALDSSGDEVALLLLARNALEAQPQRALALCSEHAQRFAQGLMSEEREAVAIEALWRLGRAAEAKARFDQLARERPRSAYLHRLARLLAAPKSDPK